MLMLINVILFCFVLFVMCVNVIRGSYTFAPNSVRVTVLSRTFCVGKTTF